MAPLVPEAKHWVKIPRAVVIHRMETADCLDSRLFWAILLWSWCGPQRSEHVVLKDEKGWIKTDAKGVPIPAKLKDLHELMGLSPSMMGSLSRAAARLEEVGSIQWGDSISGRGKAKVMYPIHEPPTTQNDLLVVSTATKDRWHVGTIVVSTASLPEDPVARTAAIQWLEDLNTEWNEALKALRTKHNELLEQGASARGILIERSSKSRLAKDPPPTSQPDLEEEPVAPEPEEEPAGRPVVEVPEYIPETIEARTITILVDAPETLKPGDTITIPAVNLVNPPGPKEVREEVKAYLESIPRPGLTPQIVDEVSKHITTPEALEAFKVETIPAKVQGAQTWRYFVAIAQRVGADAPRYAAAKANGGNGHSPPKSRSETLKEEFLREIRTGERTPSKQAEAFARKVEAEEKARGR